MVLMRVILTNDKPDSPLSWLGKEDFFWTLGEDGPKPIERRCTDGLINRLFCPMIDGEVVPHPRIGLSIRSREDVGMSHNILLAGADSRHGTN